MDYYLFSTKSDQPLDSGYISIIRRSLQPVQRLSTLCFFPGTSLSALTRLVNFHVLSLSLSLSFTCASNYICIYVTEHYDFHRHIDSISAFSTNMSSLRDYKPAMAMLALQFSYAVVALSTRAALLQGMNPRVFVVYRQAIATLFMAPMAYLSRVTINQNTYFEGLYLASSSMASAMGNLIPAITFVMASTAGLEKIDLGSVRSVAKILGTIFCVGGAISMALLRGPKLLNTEFLPEKSFLFRSSGGENWLLGCLFLFASACCWSLWLILQVPVSASYPDHLSLSAWMCFLATLQSATFAIFTEPDPEAWNLHSSLEIFCCFFSGAIGSGVSFCVQAWCISKRGPLFSAMFNPLCTVIVTILAALLLHEEIYTGSLVGAIGVILGLYAVLWGKAKDHFDEEEPKLKLQSDDQAQAVKILRDDSCKVDLEEPLLCDKTAEDYASNIH
ncbi:WAT1-related protein [Citrus sinensis]|uniref:WAT1-related protein n=1 Tax=Citrus sinensis TaxID=2711 RepID=A0ACB8P886_CITSI|nr:WAT1-related protein [Citrus sinensis]